MTANYELWYADDLGKRLAYINDVMSFEYVKVIGDIGIGAFQFSNRPSAYRANIPDRRIHVYRQPIGGRLALDFSCRLRRFDTETTRDGQFWRSLVGADNNEILARYIVASAAETDEAQLTNQYVDDGMKDIYANTVATVLDSDQGFSADGDHSLGPQIDKAFAWRNVLAVLQDLQADSFANGNEVFFGLVDGGETTQAFRTWINQPGRDLIDKIVFSLERGNLSNPRLSYDYSDMATLVYATGQGQQSNRIVQAAEDDILRTISRVAHTEKFRHSSGDTIALVQSDANDELLRHRPRVNFSASISDTPLVRYGRDWQLGDKVTVSYAGIQLDTIIRSVRVRVEPSGQETIDSRVEATYTTNLEI